MTTIHSSHFSVQPLAPGVWAVLAEPGRGLWGNAGIIDLGDRTLVFDTGVTPQAAEELRSAAHTLTGRPVSLVVNSHYHEDHMLGNATFVEAQIIATGQTRELIAARATRNLAFFRSHLPAEIARIQATLQTEQNPIRRRDMALEIGTYQEVQANIQQIAIRLPDITFDHRLNLHGSQREAQVLTFGGGHTPSDAVLYLPTERILFAGDLVQIGYHVLLGTGNPDEWQQILLALAALQPSVVVPGHGPLGTGEAITAVGTYIADLQKLARQALEQGSTPEEAVSQEVPSAYADWRHSENFGLNLRFLAERLKG